MTDRLKRGDDVFVCTRAPGGPVHILMATRIDTMTSMSNIRPVACTIDGQIFTSEIGGTTWHAVSGQEDLFMVLASDENATAIAEGRMPRPAEVLGASDGDLQDKISEAEASVAAARGEIDGLHEVVEYWEHLVSREKRDLKLHKRQLEEKILVRHQMMPILNARLEAAEAALSALRERQPAQ